MEYKIIARKESDWEEVSRIYYEGIKTGKATLETEVPTWEYWNDNLLAWINEYNEQNDLPEVSYAVNPRNVGKSGHRRVC